MPEVRIVAVSEPRIPECKTAGEMVAYCARVSNPANQANHETAGKLLRYLARNHHWSPFEMVSVTMEIITTRDIARQILRHRSFSFQEFSQRYAAVVDFADPRPARMQDAKNRQNSTPAEDADLAAWWDQAQQNVLNDIEQTYQAALDAGIAKEVARSILPEGLTSSRLYMAGTLRSWVHYIMLRTGNGTQIEHKEIAERAQLALVLEFPDLVDFFLVEPGDGVK
jgi:thymidylate synthase (FAD)